MTHLRIEQSTSGNEYVTSDVIHKLYETAKGILDEEALNEVEESQVSLQGSLVVPKAYGDEIDWLETKFPDLHINVTVGTYVSFEDAEVERLLKTNYPNVGDGIGFTQLELYGIGPISGDVFYNSSITKFNELLYFNPLSITSLSNFCSDCTLLTEVTLPVGTDRFRSNMFAGCTSLTTIRNTEGITTIETGGIGGCSSLLTINLPNLTTLGNWACNDTGLRSIDLSNITSMGRNALESNSSLTSVGNLNPSFTTIPQECFKNCTSLASIDLSNVTSIGESAFEGCTGLTSIDLSNVTSIGASAFQGCTSLTSIDVSNILSGNLSSTFEGCTSLTSVTLPSTSFTWGNDVERHKSVFLGCTSLTSIDMSNATFIGLLYFQGCTALTTCIWPTSITTIPQSCFNGCSSLASIDIDWSNITTIGRSAFEACTSLTSVDLSSCTSLGYNAFRDCTNLGTNLTLELNLTNLTSNYGGALYNTKFSRVILHGHNTYREDNNNQPLCNFTNATYIDASDYLLQTNDSGHSMYSLFNDSSLITLILPPTVNRIDAHSVLHATASTLRYLIILNTTPPSLNTTDPNNPLSSQIRSENLHIYVPDSAVNDYLSDSSWSLLGHNGTVVINDRLHGLSELPAGVWTTGLASQYLTPAQLATS